MLPQMYSPKAQHIQKPAAAACLGRQQAPRRVPNCQRIAGGCLDTETKQRRPPTSATLPPSAYVQTHAGTSTGAIAGRIPSAAVNTSQAQHNCQATEVALAAADRCHK